MNSLEVRIKESELRQLYAVGALVLAFVVLPKSTQAQINAAEGGNASVMVTAAVTITPALTSLEVIINQPILSFGEVSAGQGQARVTRTSSEAGMFTIRGAAGSSVRVRFNGPPGGALVAGQSEVDITTDVYGAQTDDPGVASLIQDGDTVTLNSDGEYYLYLEGTLEMDQGQPAPSDDYSGAFTLVVSYDQG